MLADDVGIIDHGKLLEEESLEELEAKNTREFIHFLVLMHDRQLKLFLLNSTIKTYLELLMGMVYLYDTTLPTDVINRLLFERRNQYLSSTFM